MKLATQTKKKRVSVSCVVWQTMKAEPGEQNDENVEEKIESNNYKRKLFTYIGRPDILQNEKMNENNDKTDRFRKPSTRT